MANPRTLVQSLKGSKAQVMIAFLLARSALDIKELRLWTGLKRETLYGVCAELESMDLLGKQTLAHGRDVYLPAGDMLPFFQMSENRTPELTVTTTIDSLELNQSKSLVVVVEGQESENRTPGADVIYDSYDASFESNMAACRRAGIGEPKRTQLSLLPHVCPRLILDHWHSLVKGETIGLAIRRIEADEVPRLWLDQIQQDYPNGRPEECEEEEDDPTGAACVWCDDDPSRVYKGRHPLAGLPVKLPRCNEPCKEGSSHWCEKHYEIGVQTYGTGIVESEDQ